MAKSSYTNYVPAWAKEHKSSILDETPNIGIEPNHAPRLPTRLIPKGGESFVSALTLIDTVQITQKILTYSAQEAAFGIQYEFSDLRSVDSSIAGLAKLRIEPFEEGSFVIPATLDEKIVELAAASPTQKSRTISTRDVLARFVDVIEGVGTNSEFAACIGVVNAVQELGRVIRRETEAIEYLPSGLASQPKGGLRLSINQSYVERVTENRERRLNIDYKPDHVIGRLIAVDLGRATLRIKLHGGSEVPGNFEPMAADAVASSLNRDVKLYGVVARRPNKQLTFVRAFTCEVLDS